MVTRPGSRKFELGAPVAGGSGPGTGGGFSIVSSYDSPTFAIPAEIRFAHSTTAIATCLSSRSTPARASTFRITTPALRRRRLLLLYLSLSDHRDGRYLEDSHWGPGLYAETGFQLFRLHRGRLTAKVRADFPLYSLHAKGVDYDPRGRIVRIDDGRRYLVPITFGLTMSF